MYHLHIICRYRSASMKRMTEPLYAEDSLPKLYTVTVSDQVDPEADINYHVPWHSMVNLEPGTSKHIIAYTHCNPSDRGALADACKRADRIVCMTFTGRRELIELGVDPQKLYVIYSGSNNFGFRRRNIGIIGFEQPNGRKRMHLLLDLAWQMSDQDRAAIYWVLVGQGMEELTTMLQNTGMEAIYKDNANDEDLNIIYGRLDALLVTAYAEGGPLPFMEAWKSGIPVFSPPVGFAGDFLDKVHTYTTTESLIKKLHNWMQPGIQNSMLAAALDWSQYAVEHALLIGRLTGTSVEISPGGDRYAQLLDIIDEIKPQSILEIGVWSGARAVQMIQEAAKFRPIESIDYVGFDLFEQQTGEYNRLEGSKDAWPKSVVERRLKATGAKFELVQGNTRDTLAGFGWRHYDFMFIDGGHSEETIKSDWNNVCTLQAVFVFDDYYFGPHPAGMGCNAIIDNLSNQWIVEHLPVRTKTEGLEIGMVKVYADLSVHGWETLTGSVSLDASRPADQLP